MVRGLKKNIANTDIQNNNAYFEKCILFGGQYIGFKRIYCEVVYMTLASTPIMHVWHNNLKTLSLKKSMYIKDFGITALPHLESCNLSRRVLLMNVRGLN